MKKYQVQINGENFLAKIDDDIQKRGFIAFCLVEAPNTEEAESLAMEQLRHDETLQELVLNDSGDPTTMNVVSVNELESFKGVPDTKGRYIWYSENEENTQQTN